MYNEDNLLSSNIIKSIDKNNISSVLKIANMMLSNKDYVKVINNPALQKFFSFSEKEIEAVKAARYLIYKENNISKLFSGFLQSNTLEFFKFIDEIDLKLSLSLKINHMVPLLNKAVIYGDEKMDWYDNKTLVEYLIDRCANCEEDINVRDCWGQTPLHYALLQDKPEIANILISRGARTDIMDCYGRTALSLMVKPLEEARDDMVDGFNLGFDFDDLQNQVFIKDSSGKHQDNLKDDHGGRELYDDSCRSI